MGTDPTEHGVVGNGVGQILRLLPQLSGIHRISDVEAQFGGDGSHRRGVVARYHPDRDALRAKSRMRGTEARAPRAKKAG